jgi:hypothetical protein
MNVYWKQIRNIFVSEDGIMVVNGDRATMVNLSLVDVLELLNSVNSMAVKHLELLKRIIEDEREFQDKNWRSDEYNLAGDILGKLYATIPLVNSLIGAIEKRREMK